MPLTVLICAICEVTCALSIGLSGSWFCICVTSSFRKRSSDPASLVLSTAEAAAVVDLAAVCELTLRVEKSMVAS